jgi:hypothetical protein
MLTKIDEDVADKIDDDTAIHMTIFNREGSHGFVSGDQVEMTSNYIVQTIAESQLTKRAVSAASQVNSFNQEKRQEGCKEE